MEPEYYKHVRFGKCRLLLKRIISYEIKYLVCEDKNPSDIILTPEQMY